MVICIHPMTQAIEIDIIHARLIELINANENRGV